MDQPTLVAESPQSPPVENRPLDLLPASLADGTESEVRFYKTNNARGDRRISIKGLKQKASAGDVVVLHQVAHAAALVVEIKA
jgi:hypothetical protein